MMYLGQPSVSQGEGGEALVVLEAVTEGGGSVVNVVRVQVQVRQPRVPLQRLGKLMLMLAMRLSSPVHTDTMEAFPKLFPWQSSDVRDSLYLRVSPIA